MSTTIVCVHSDSRIYYCIAPSTIKQEGGTLRFTTYDERPVNPCNDVEKKYYDENEYVGCDFSTSGQIDVGQIYNDVWAYKLCNANGTDPERGFDTACKDTGWVLWHAGALQGGMLMYICMFIYNTVLLNFMKVLIEFCADSAGFFTYCTYYTIGCTIQLGIEVCTAPSERYNHASVMHDDGTLYVYGGFSQRCGDYCDDIWFFDIYQKVRTYCMYYRYMYCLYTPPSLTHSVSTCAFSSTVVVTSLHTKSLLYTPSYLSIPLLPLQGWRQVYAAGALTSFYTDTFFDEVLTNDPVLVPIDNSTSKFAGEHPISAQNYCCTTVQYYY